MSGEIKSFKKTIAKNFKAIVKDKRMTYTEIANQECVDYQTVSRLGNENDWTNPSFYTVYKICSALNISIDDLTKTTPTNIDKSIIFNLRYADPDLKIILSKLLKKSKNSI